MRIAIIYLLFTIQTILVHENFSIIKSGSGISVMSSNVNELTDYEFRMIPQ